MQYATQRPKRPLAANIVARLCLASAILVLLSGSLRAQDPDRSPVDVVLSPDERWLVTANQTSDSVSLVDVQSGLVVQELAVARRPAGLAMAPDGRRLLVACTWSGTIEVLELGDGRLTREQSIEVGYQPIGLAITSDGRFAYAAQEAAASVAVLDLEKKEVAGTIGVGRWPRHLALSPDGSRLAVGTSGDQSISVVDTHSRELLYQERFGGINAGHMVASADGQFAYFPWMIYRTNPITERNIQLGWVLGTRIARVRLDGPARRQAMTLDPRGEAVSDPYGIALSSDESWLIASASGTHELLVYRMKDLVFQDSGGPGDHIDPVLLNNPDKFYRIELGGRPMGIRMSRDDEHVFVANYLNNSVQVVDLASRRIEREIALGGPQVPSLARRGEAIFYDGGRSLDQWYSCHSCHYEGGSNAVAMDTTNDGSDRTFKTVLPLVNLPHTGPWTWHGWQTDLKSAMHKSLTETMLGPQPSDEDIEALLAFFDAMEAPPNPFRGPQGTLSQAAERGRQVFESSQAGCATCHTGPLFTDGQVHDVGLGRERDLYQGFNTPSLSGVYRRVRFLHDGRAKSLQKVLTGAHNPAKVAGSGELSEAQQADLIEYLKSL